MDNSKNIITVVIIVVVSALIVGLFIFYGGSNSDVQSGLRVDLPNGANNQPILSRELLAALASVKDLKLDPAFFKDTAFASLRDYSKDIQDEEKGRDNPFLPVTSTVGTPAVTPAP